MDENIILDFFFFFKDETNEAWYLPYVFRTFLSQFFRPLFKFCKLFKRCFKNWLVSVRFKSLQHNVLNNAWHLFLSLWRRAVFDSSNNGRIQDSYVKLWFCPSIVVLNLQCRIPFHLLLWEKSELWRVFLADNAMNIQHKGRSNATHLILNYLVVVRWNWAVSDR